MRQFLPILCLLFIHQFLPGQESLDIIERKSIIRSHFISDVWSGHPVQFDILTTTDRQYVGYYNETRDMCIAQRELGSGDWTVAKLSSKLGWDSHNSIALASDKYGHLHVSGNMHGVPLVYFRSKTAHDINSFERLPMVGTEEDRVTYPVFFKDHEGELYFQYRDGGSGNGITYINRYDADHQIWSRVLNQGLFDGEGETNAYPTNPIKGPDGFFHYMWVWRLNPIANTNHNLSYVRTRDFVEFENIEGISIPIPIKYSEGRVIADPVGPWNGLMNSSKLLSFDSKGRVIFGYHKFDPQGRSQFFICRRQHGQWINKQVSDWPDYSWPINKRGSLGKAIALEDIRSDGNGHIYLGYSHIQYGTGLLKIDENTLELLDDLRGETFTYLDGLSSELLPNMQWNQKMDDSRQFMLRWQTLPSNFDRPRDPPYPGPTKLMLHELTDQ